MVSQTPVVMVQSRKQEVGQMAKSTLRLREIDGLYGNEYLCTLLGAIAEFEFTPGQIVVAALRFSTHEGPNGGLYQDITSNNIVIISEC